MADKYIIHGATFNGDGTSSAAATSNGGVGAWNNINIWEGTAPSFGALAAGDRVNIRSKDASDAAITRTMAASTSLGSASATSGAWIEWVIDNGTVWPGVDGVITYTHASTFALTFRQYNLFYAKTRGALVVKNTSANQGAGTVLSINNGYVIGATFDWTAKTGSGACYAVQGGSDSTLENCLVTWGVVGTTPSDPNRGLIQSLGTLNKVNILGVDVVLNSNTPGQAVYINGFASRALMNIIGGSISGVGATSGQPVFCPNSYGGGYRSVGLQFPRTMDIAYSGFTGQSYEFGSNLLEVIGCDNGVGGHIEKEWGFATSRTDSNPPTLQALLPDSAGSAWSWRVYPKSVSRSFPMMLTAGKYFTDTAAAKTITQEILVANTMSPDKNTLWMTVEYIDDATGVTKHITTKDFSAPALDASTASWSATVWGAITFVKRKLSITTPTSVKKDTLITVTLWSTLASGSANDIYFVDPDFGVI